MRIVISAIATAILAVAGGCGASSSPSSSTPSPAPAPAAPASTDPAALAPRPFVAADLRAAMTVGTEIRYRIVTAGQPTVIQHWTVTAADADGCTIRSRTLSEDGATVLVDESGTSKWSELEQHADFPAARTVRTESSIEVAAGKFDTWLYEVAPGKAGEGFKRIHFARTLPGPPVWMEETLGDQVVTKLELVSRTSP